MEICFRWTIGNSSKIGFDILAESVKKIKMFYPRSFRFICYNNISTESLEFIKKLDATLVNQNKVENVFNAKKCLWAITPPRLKINCHEIFMDNDIIIYKKLPIISNFRKSSNIFFVTEGKKAHFGKYRPLIPLGKRINTGFFGIPPDFNLKNKVLEVRKELEDLLQGQEVKEDEEDHFDYQGIVSAVLVKNNVVIIPMEDINICYKNLVFGNYGVHFVHANRKEQHAAWEQYKRSTLLNLSYNKLYNDEVIEEPYNRSRKPTEIWFEQSTT